MYQRLLCEGAMPVGLSYPVLAFDRVCCTVESTAEHICEYVVLFRSVISANFAQLRLLANEDTSVGLWMLSANVTFFEDMRLCSPICT